MKLKKLLAIGALVPALLLAGCTGNPAPEPTPQPEPSGSPTIINPSNSVEWTDELLYGYMNTAEFNETASLYGDKIEYDDPNAYRTLPQATVAVWTVNKYIEAAYDSGYFIADWWGDRDNYSQAGIEQVSKYTTSPLTEKFASVALALSKNPDDAEALAWVSPRVYMPPTNSDWMVLDTCESEWQMIACRLEAPEISTYKVTRDEDAKVTVTVQVNVTPLYGQVIDGLTGVTPRTYDLVFTLIPNKLPPKFDMESGNSEEDVIGSEENTPELSEEPYYLISNIEAKVSEGTPYNPYE